MKSVLRFLWDFIYFLSGEGTWRLRPHERIVLEAAISTFPDTVQTPLRAQLNQGVFVIRANRLVSRPRFSAAAIESTELRHNLLKVDVDVEGKKDTAHVEFYRGRIDSIQFKHPATFYTGKPIKVLGVHPGNPNLSHSAALDRLEHGSQP